MLVVSKKVGAHVDRIARQRRRVVPALPEAGFDVGHSRALDRNLEVMPRWPKAIVVGHLLGLGVTTMAGVVTSAMAQVDPADEGDVALRIPWMAQHHELLVMRAAGTYAHVALALSAGGLDLLAQVPVLLLAEREAIQVRAPHQTLDGDTASSGILQHLRYLGSRTVEALVGVAAPIGEHQQIAGTHGAYRLQQRREIGCPVHQCSYVVPRAPRRTVRMSTIHLGCGIAALVGAQEPVTDDHGSI